MTRTKFWIEIWSRCVVFFPSSHFPALRNKPRRWWIIFVNCWIISLRWSLGIWFFFFDCYFVVIWGVDTRYAADDQIRLSLHRNTNGERFFGWFYRIAYIGLHYCCCCFFSRKSEISISLIHDSRTQTLFAGRLFSIKLTRKWLMNTKWVFFCCAVYFVFGHGLDSADIVNAKQTKQKLQQFRVWLARATNIRQDREEREMNELCCDSFVIRTKWKLNFHHFNISYSRLFYSQRCNSFFSSLAQSHTSSRWGNLIVDVRERNDEQCRALATGYMRARIIIID